mmetsp:Transcript_21698/g.66764  ORF Transcript_21698/g.66764 Transcript_21698/m.66764 type:complete len:107 (+) Transcript_21698:216-536(+)
MAKQGRLGLSRKALPGKAKAKGLRKQEASRNVEKKMLTSAKAKSRQPARRERAPRKVDIEKRARAEKEPSPAEPRPDGRFAFSHPNEKKRIDARKARDGAAKMRDD